MKVPDQQQGYKVGQPTSKIGSRLSYTIFGGCSLKTKVETMHDQMGNGNAIRLQTLIYKTERKPREDEGSLNSEDRNSLTKCWVFREF